MRNRLMIGAAALLLASATTASAQGTPQQETTPPSNGVVDIGGRFTSMSGDQARYERYRDLRSGVNANVVFNKETENWVFNVKASNIGYRDQRYTMDYSSERVKVSFLFDSIPLNYGYDLEDAVRLHRRELRARSRHAGEHPERPRHRPRDR